MASSFFGLYVQRDALQIAQKALDITGHNITNIKTEGYSRQRVDIVSVANKAGCLGYNTQVSLAGQGADTVGVSQVRDTLLDAKVRKYNAELCETGAKTEILADIEDILDDIENQDAGLSAIFGDLKSAFQSFSATGADRKDLANVAKNKADSVVNVLKNFDMRLNDVEVATRQDIESNTKKINTILREMGNLNSQIKDSYVMMNNIFATPSDYQAEIDYGPLELKDKLNLLCDELSQYVPINVTQEKDGTYTVSLISKGEGAKTLVHEDGYAKVDWQFSDEQPERNDFAQFFVSDLNSEKDWKKSLREINDEIRLASLADPLNGTIDPATNKEYKNLETLINELNNLIYDGRVEEAYHFEKDKVMPMADSYGIEYKPIYDKNIDDYNAAHTPQIVKPTYVIKVDDITKDFDKDEIEGGTIKGLFDMYNGKGCYADIGENEYRGIKYYQETILAFAKTMVKDFNKIYDEHNTKNGDNFKLFEFRDGIEKLENLQVAQTWEDNSIRCVHPLVDAQGEPIYNYDELDNTFLNKILATFDNERDFGREPEKYTFENFIKNYGDNVGSQLEYELGSFDSAESMLKSVSEAREEVMGVSMDEEGVNMMNYQKWYNAIARMINALDECLEKLINGTGLVGR